MVIRSTGMSRRSFMALVSAGVVAMPLVAAPQPAGKVYRVGILGNVPLTDPEGAKLWGAFVQGLRELGYVEGQNLTIEHRSSEGQHERVPALAEALVQLKVDVIVVPAGSSAVAARRVTRTVPIVGTSLGGDPTSSGLATSFARPGGNVTGLSFAGPELGGKQMELLRDVVPGVSRVAVLWNPSNGLHSAWVREARSAGQSLRIQVRGVEARKPDELDGAFAAMTRAGAGALLVLPDGMFLLHRTRLAALAAERRIPAMYGVRAHVDAGGLVFYGTSLRESFRRAAMYVDKILRGVSPGDLPIEQPNKFELVINLKTARALLVNIPSAVLQRADEVIE